MPLFSITYTTNQYSTELYHCETSAPRNYRNPLRTSHLGGSKGRFLWFRRVGWHPAGDNLGQAKRDKFHLFWPVKYPVGIYLFHQNPDAAEGNTRNDGESSQDCAENDNVFQQCIEIAHFLIVGPLVPRAFRLVVHGTQEKFCFVFGKWSRGNGDDGTSSLHEELP